MDHVVVLNFFRAQVWDCGKKTALKLRHGVLDLCVGPDAQLGGVREERKMGSQSS